MTQKAVDCVVNEPSKSKADIRISGSVGYSIIFKNCKHLNFHGARILGCIVNEFSESKKVDK